MSRFAALAFLAAVAVPTAQATFDVASIRPNRTGVPQMVIRTPPSGLVTATNVTAEMLIRYAYEVQRFRVVNAPEWASSDHFDVNARTAAGTPATAVPAMFRALLAERFNLFVHRQPRTMPVDIIIVTPGMNPRLTAATTRCEPARPPCMRRAFGRISGQGVTMGDLIASLSLATDRVVIDETGLTARYDFSLEYTPDAVALMDPAAARAEFPRIDQAGPALKTALREQLGLTLRTEDRPVEVIVVDRLERPGPN